MPLHNWREASAAATIESAESDAYVPQVSGTYVLVETVGATTRCVGRPHESREYIGIRLKHRIGAWARNGYADTAIDYVHRLSKLGMKPIWLRIERTAALPGHVIATIK